MGLSKTWKKKPLEQTQKIKMYKIILSCFNNDKNAA